jgi:hypothetical protein
MKIIKRLFQFFTHYRWKCVVCNKTYYNDNFGCGWNHYPDIGRVSLTCSSRTCQIASDYNNDAVERCRIQRWPIDHIGPNPSSSGIQ